MFTLQINVHHDGPFAQAILSAIADLSRKVDKLARVSRAEFGMVMKEIDDLESAVKEDTDAENSAITLIQKLADQIAANATDPARITQLAQNLRASSAALAAAVVANTPHEDTTGGGGGTDTVAGA
jgi:hypothetical protein